MNRGHCVIRTMRRGVPCRGVKGAGSQGRSMPVTPKGLAVGVLSAALLVSAGTSCGRAEKPMASEDNSTPGSQTPGSEATGYQAPDDRVPAIKTPGNKPSEKGTLDRAAVPPGQTPPLPPHETVAQCLAIMDAYYRRDPREELPAKINAAIDTFNESAKGRVSEFEAERHKLNEMVDSIKEMGERVGKLDDQLKKQKKTSMTNEEVPAYNQLVTQYNELGTKYVAKRAEYDKRNATLEEAVAEFRKISADSKRKIDEVKMTGEKRIAEYVDWHTTDKGLAFFEWVTTTYACLIQMKKTGNGPAQLDEDLATIRAMRRELGEHTRQRQERLENGLIVVPGNLCGREDSYFIVDTGASVVTLSPSMVESLGLSDQLGQVVTITLAAGIRIQGRELTIPQLTVYGKTAEQVKAVMVAPSVVGVDGLLGHSFLNQFDYRIDRTHDPKLTLEPKSVR
jgi:clan AA aspartic protease (TIGR02281 family)